MKSANLKLARRTRAYVLASLTIAAAITAAGTGWAATPVSLTSTTFTENFDSIGAGGTALPGGWGFSNIRNQPGGGLNNYAGALTTANLNATSLTSSSTGAAYVFDAGSAESAIGFLNSSTFASPQSIYFGFVNNTGSMITDLTLGWDYEKYRSGTREWNFAFSTSTNGTVFSSVTDGDQNFPGDPANTVASFPPIVTNKSGITISGVNIAAGASYFFQWTLTGTGGSTNGQALGIDNFSLTATLGTANNISTLLWTGGNASWDTSSSRWQNLAPNDTAWNNATGGTISAVFNTASVVSVDAGGITAKELQFQDGADGAVINGPGVLTLATGAISVGTLSHVTIGAQLSGGNGITVFGGTTTLTNAANDFTGNVSISSAALAVSADGALGSSANAVSFANGTLITFGSFSTDRDFLFAGNGTIDTAGNNLEVNGHISGSGIFTKTGDGVITLNTPDANPPGFFSGEAQVRGGTLRLTTVDGNGFTALGSGTIRVFSGATLHLDNVAVGKLRNSGVQPGFVDLYTGSTIKATGNSSYENRNVAVVFNFDTNASAYSPANVSVLLTSTAGSPGTLTLKNAFQQFNAFENDYTNFDTGTMTANPDKNIIVSVNSDIPGGRLILQDGGVSSRLTFGGEWQVNNNAILQVGPYVANAAPGSAAGEWGGPFGQPLNALGFKTPNGQAVGAQNGDPDAPNRVTVNAGGILAIAVDQVNTNPNITVPPLNDTPNYIRSPIVLNGGAIAATGSEVSFGAAATDPQGIPTGVPVVARFGGDFTVNPGTSKVLVYDPVDGGPRTVELVAGSRTIANQSPGFAAGTVLTQTTAWNGNLIVDPGNTTGGVFNIARTAGNVSVTPGARITVLPNATLTLNGVGALSDGTNSVDIENNSVTSLQVQTGSHTVGQVTGIGNTSVSAGASLTARSIVQDQLSIQGQVHLSAGATASKVNSLTIGGIPGNWTGKLDLGDNALILPSANLAAQALVVAQVQDQVNSGKAGGTWSGNGITSSTIPAINGTTGSYTLAVADVGDLNLTTYRGQTGIDANTTIVVMAHNGDATLDGKVDAFDLNLLAAHWQQPLGALWSAGDFTGDGKVDAFDLNVLAANWQFGVAGSLQSALAQFPQLANAAPVPEPASLAVLALGGTALLARRKRR